MRDFAPYRPPFESAHLSWSGARRSSLSPTFSTTMPAPHQDPARDSRDPRQLLANDEKLSELQAAQEVAAAKVAAFGLGTTRKSKHELEKERAALKQLKEDQEAAQAYEDFVASFDGGEEQGGRGGRAAGKGFVRAGGGEGYNPLKDRAPIAAPSTPAIPTGPRAMRPAAAALMDDDEVRSLLTGSSLGA